MENEEKLLQNAGLTNTDAKVYLTLLKLGSATGGEISKTNGQYRANVYRSLEKLAKLGLVGSIEKEGKRYFEAAHPSRLVQIIDEKKAQLQAILPLILLNQNKHRMQQAKIFAGKEGLKSILEDILKTKPREWLDFTSGMTVYVLPNYIDFWHKKRIKAGIKGRILINQTPKGVKRAKKLRCFPFTKVKFLPKGLKSPIHIYIYNNKVALTLWGAENPFGILIEEKEIAKRFSEFFAWFWKNSY